jgi:acetylornithine deacetylase/succinyl-diaminopimelate desuccinylase-like protein
LSLDALRDAARAIDPNPVADLTLDLLRIWSPPGSEGEMAGRMADELAAAGARVRIDREFPSSPSVIAELGAAEGEGPTIQWHGHLDAIDVEHTPPERHDGLLVGRGAADMKGPDAAMVAALRLLREHGLPERGRVLVTLHGMHESGGNEPLHALIKRGIHGDAVITGELGGGVELPIAGLGLTFWEIVVERAGMALHETVVPRGTIDPLEVGRLVHAELVAVRDRLAATGEDASRPSLFIGKFVSGDYYNRLPVRAELAGTRRHNETSDLAAVAAELEELVDRVRAATGAAIALRSVPIAESFSVDPGDPLVRATLDAHRDLFGRELRLSRSRVASNAVHFVREAGIPAVGYGPDPATNHSDREVLPVTELSRIAAGFAIASAYYLERAGR